MVTLQVSPTNPVRVHPFKYSVVETLVQLAAMYRPAQAGVQQEVLTKVPVEGGAQVNAFMDS